MNITRVAAANFKGQTFSDQWFPITKITGPNSTGKSARLEAFWLALLGYMPGDKPVKSHRELFHLYASGNPMKVLIDITYDALPGSRQTVERIWSESRGTVTHQGPEEPIVPAEAIDCAAYLGLSGPERLRFLLKRMQAAGVKIPAVAATIVANLKNLKLEENTVHTESAIGAVAETVRAAEAKNGKASIADWVAALAETIKSNKLAADQNVRRLQATLQGMTQTRSTGEAAPANAEDALRRAQEEFRKAEATVTELATSLNECRRQWRAEDSAAKACGDREAMQKELDQLVTFPAVEQPNGKEVAEAAEADKQAGLTANRLQMEELRLKKELEDLKKEKVCSKCGQSLAKVKKAANQKLEEQLEAASLLATPAVMASMKTEGELKRLKAEFDKGLRAAREHTERLARISVLRQRLSMMESATAAAAKLPALSQRGKELAAQLSQAEAKAREAGQAVTAADEAFRRLTAERADKAARARALEQAERAKAETTVLAAAVKLLTALQEEIVERAVGPLVDRINALCGTILPSPMQYRDGELMLQAGYSHRTASDSEKLLIYAGLCLALASVPEPTFKLAVISRFESFDPKRGDALVALARSLIEKKQLDQCVLVEVAHQIGPLQVLEL
jgi:hypothetical protein